MTVVENILNLKFWSYALLGNTLGDYALALLAFLVGLVVFKLLQWFVLGRLKSLAEKTATDIDNTLIKIVKNIRPPFYSFLAAYFALRFIYLSSWLESVINVVLIGWVIYEIVQAMGVAVDFIVKRIVGEKMEPDEVSKKTAVELLGKVAKGVLWVVGILMALANFGVDVSTLIAGMGVGGIAVAIAAQSILEDLFSSFVIFFDKPFEVGDFIMVDDKKGEVEKIGIKTTHIKSISGEQIIMSNNRLTGSVIQNFGRMEDRRATLSFGVEYGTPQEKLEEIPEMVRKIVEDTEDVELNRVFFEEFGDSAIVFELVYFVQSPEYEVYGRKNQDIAFAINEKFQEEGIDMAFPTRTVYMRK